MRHLLLMICVISTLSLKSNVDTTLTLKNVYQQLLNDSIKYPDIVLKQIIVETGWLKSKYCIQYNNLTGFRGKNGYKKYNNWKDCIKDYKRWQDKHYKGGDYYNFLLKIGYSEKGIEYINYLKRIKIPKYIYE